MNKNKIIMSAVLATSLLGVSFGGYMYYQDHLQKQEKIKSEKALKAKKIKEDLEKKRAVMIHDYDLSKKDLLKGQKKEKVLTLNKVKFVNAHLADEKKLKSELKSLEKIELSEVEINGLFDYIEKDNNLKSIIINEKLKEPSEENMLPDIGMKNPMNFQPKKNVNKAVVEQSEKKQEKETPIKEKNEKIVDSSDKTFSFLQDKKKMDEIISYDLNTLKYLSNLEEAKIVDVSGVRDSNLNSLSSLKKVEVLKINGSDITDISGLNSLKEGRLYLNTNYKSIQSKLDADSYLCDSHSIYQALGGKNKYQRVVHQDYGKFCEVKMDSATFVIDGKKVDISSLKDFKGSKAAVKSIEIKTKGNIKIESLEEFKTLRSITIDAGSISSLGVFNDVLGLEEINLVNLSVGQSKTSFKTLGNLKSLTLNNVNGYEPILDSLESFNTLKNIELSNLNIKSFPWRIKSLESFSVQRSFLLESLSGLKGLKSLKKIEIKDSRLKTLNDLTGLESLNEIKMSNNKLMVDLRVLKDYFSIKKDIDNKNLLYK